MRARKLWVGAALMCTALVPATADAATLVNSGGRLTYTGQPGEQNTVEFEPYQGAVYVGPMTGSASGCTQANPTSFACRNVSSIAADLGDGDDRVWAGGPFPSFLSGGPGDDELDPVRTRGGQHRHRGTGARRRVPRLQGRAAHHDHARRPPE